MFSATFRDRLCRITNPWGGRGGGGGGGGESHVCIQDGPTWDNIQNTSSSLVISAVNRLTANTNDVI